MIEKILVVDDDEMVREILAEILTEENYEVYQAVNGEDALALLEKQPVDGVITDIQMPRMNGLELLQHLREKHPSLWSMAISSSGDIQLAVTAMKLGAYDYISKPLEPEELLVKIKKLEEFHRQKEENQSLRDQLEHQYRFDKIIGKSKAMKRVFERMRMVAPSHATVLIQGASGTGKELVAQGLHYNSLVRKGPFIKVSCGIFHQDILESELFGHERGAFTGAIRQKKGRFEMAQGGTIFLDDIDDVPLATQVKLLRVLQEREIERMGGDKVIPLQVRILTASKVDLKEKVEKGEFREDLFYRLNVVPITLPPLLERREDIPLLARHFAKKYARENKKTLAKIHDSALQALVEYSWPGNVRQLENALEHAVVFCGKKIIQISHLPREIRDGPRGAGGGEGQEGGKEQSAEESLRESTKGRGEEGKSAKEKMELLKDETRDFRKEVSAFEKILLQWAFEKTGGHQRKMAGLLHLPPTTLRDKLLRFGLI